eukprot:6471669-Pyramimonas_sp.AAC.1
MSQAVCLFGGLEAGEFKTYSEDVSRARRLLQYRRRPDREDVSTEALGFAPPTLVYARPQCHFDVGGTTADKMEEGGRTGRMPQEGGAGRQRSEE